MYSFKSRVRYSECDEKSHMTLSALVNYLQDSCTFQSEFLNLGMKYWEDKRAAWVLSCWHIVIDRFPKLGEEISIGTWAYDFTRFMGYRNFIIKDKDAQVMAHANSLWAYVDTETGKLKRVEEEQKLLYSAEPAYPMETLSRKVDIPSKMAAKEVFKVQRFYLDSNLHVNNEKYILMAMEYLPDNSRINSVRVEYHHAAVLGDMIYPQVGIEDNKVTVLLGNEDMKPFAVVQFLVSKDC
jgi:medium-chain acyl-[acyl-carrier-protein] hydrolase